MRFCTIYRKLQFLLKVQILYDFMFIFNYEIDNINIKKSK